MSADKLKYAVFMAGDKSVRNDNYYALEVQTSIIKKEIRSAAFRF